MRARVRAHYRTGYLSVHTNKFAPAESGAFSQIRNGGIRTVGKRHAAPVDSGTENIVRRQISRAETIGQHLLYERCALFLLHVQKLKLVRCKIAVKHGD